MSILLPSPHSTPGLALASPKPPRAKFNVGLNREETKQRMNKTVEMMWMERHPEETGLLIYGVSFQKQI